MKLRNALFFGVLAALSNIAPADTIKIATVAPDGTAWMKELRASADTVKQRTEGRVEVKFYPGGVMGDPATVLRKIKIGQLQGGAFTGGEISGVVPDAQLYSLPFIFQDQAEVDAVRKKLDDKVKAAFEPNGFVALGLSGGGFAYLMSTRDIKTRDDLKAAKVWVPQGDHIADVAFKAAGVSPTPLPLADVYTSLQTGLIDTAANTPAGAIAFQWHTKVKHIIDLPVTYVMGVLVVDKKAVDKLSAPDQTALREEMNKAFAKLDQINRDDNTKALETLKGQGITLHTPTADEQKLWQSTGADAIKELEGEKAVTPELLKQLNDVIATVRKK